MVLVEMTFVRVVAFVPAFVMCSFLTSLPSTRSLENSDEEDISKFDAQMAKGQR